MIKTIIFVIVIITILIYLVIRYSGQNIHRTSHQINQLFTQYSHDPAVLDTLQFPWTRAFRTNYQLIRNEFLKYRHPIPTHHQINTVVADCDIENKWKTLYLRAFGKNTAISKYFPITMRLINSCPCTLAFFSILEPGAKLETHIGIYKGVIRYHLALIVPDDWTKCFLKVNDHMLFWKEGEDLMFDDMFPHSAENNTNQSRIILFLDIKRDFHNPFLNLLNHLCLKMIKSNDTLNHTIDNVNRALP